jgi:hypothetical protein
MFILIKDLDTNTFKFSYLIHSSYNSTVFSCFIYDTNISTGSVLTFSLYIYMHVYIHICMYKFKL